MTFCKHQADFTWDQVKILNYKETGTHFKAITRQILFEGGPELPAQLRYFEIEPGGHSTLERHDHLHVVMVIRGQGRALLGDHLHDLEKFDLLTIPAHAWHQFQPVGKEPLGFLCLVNIERDRPQRPNAEQLHALKSRPEIAGFIKL